MSSSSILIAVRLLPGFVELGTGVVVVSGAGQRKQCTYITAPERERERERERVINLNEITFTHFT